MFTTWVSVLLHLNWLKSWCVRICLQMSMFLQNEEVLWGWAAVTFPPSTVPLCACSQNFANFHKKSRPDSGWMHDIKREGEKWGLVVRQSTDNMQTRNHDWQASFVHLARLWKYLKVQWWFKFYNRKITSDANVLMKWLSRCSYNISPKS